MWNKNFLLTLREAHHRQICQAQATNNLQRRAQLALTAVDNHQIGQILVVLVATVHNLLHGLKVVRLALGRNNFILAVILLADTAIAKNDH